MKRPRLILKPQDIEKLQNCSDSYARRVVRKIKAANKKTKEQFITPREFAQYYEIDLKDIYITLEWEIPEAFIKNPKLFKTNKKSKSY